ncbi:unnamed protein product [Lampetra planeri]
MIAQRTDDAALRLVRAFALLDGAFTNGEDSDLNSVRIKEAGGMCITTITTITIITGVHADKACPWEATQFGKQS